MGRMLQVKMTLPLHPVANEVDPRMHPLGASMREEASVDEADEFLSALAQCQDGHEKLAATNRWKSGKTGGGGRFQPRRADGPRGGRRERAPRPAAA